MSMSTSKTFDGPMRLSVLLTAAFAVGGLVHDLSPIVQVCCVVLFGAVCGLTARRVMLQFVLEGMKIIRIDDSSTNMPSTVAYAHANPHCDCKNCSRERRIDESIVNLDTEEE